MMRYTCLAPVTRRAAGESCKPGGDPVNRHDLAGSPQLDRCPGHAVDN